jgi:hypothetical protein
MAALGLVVIHDLNIFRMPLNPAKADSELIVDADAVMPGTITLEGFQSIAWWHTQELQ